MSSSSFPVRPHDSRLFGTERSMEKTASGAGVVLLGRILFSAIFIFGGFSNFTQKGIDAAAQAGVPMASVLVPLAGVLASLGGLSVLLGYHARIGAWGIVLFLAIVTPVMHNFWSVTDPGVAQMQQINFMKNVAMLGAALMITHFGAGLLSIDARRR
jgi:putative oxidoreductase